MRKKIKYLGLVLFFICCSDNNKINGNRINKPQPLIPQNPDFKSINVDTYEIEYFDGEIVIGKSSNGNNDVDSYNAMEFDEKGNLITGIVKYATGRYFFKDEFIYDLQNNLIQKQRFFEANVTNKKIWKFHYSNNKIEIIGTEKPVFGFGSEYPYNKFILTLNDEGQILTEFEYGNNGSSRLGYNESSFNKRIFEYDENGHLKNENIYIGSNIVRTKHFEYNDKNLISEIEIIGENSKKLNFNYKYDERGNWIEKIDYLKNEPVFITKRKIIYKK